MSKNSAGGRRRPVTIHEINAEFRGVRSEDELEEHLEMWSDDEVVIEAPKEGELRFTQD